MVDFRIVRDQQPSFHRRDVMGVEGAEGVDVAEGSAEPPVQARAHGLAVVLEQDQVVRVAKRPNAIERGRVAQNADRDDHPGTRSERGFQPGDIHVQRLELDINESQLQPVLLQRVERGRPRDRGDDHFITPLQRPGRAVEQRRNADEIRRRSRVDHDRVFHAESGGEGVLERADTIAHREAAASHHVLHRVELFVPPARTGQLVCHQERTSARAASAIRAASG
jgi:hypothetical protein